MASDDTYPSASIPVPVEFRTSVQDMLSQCTHADRETREYVITKISNKLKLKNDVNSFIGSQVVSITKDNLINLTRMPYFVTWKADGVRFLLYIDNKGIYRTVLFYY